MINEELETEPFDDNKAYDFYWNDWSSWDWVYKQLSDEAIERILKRHGKS